MIGIFDCDSEYNVVVTITFAAVIVVFVDFDIVRKMYLKLISQLIILHSYFWADMSILKPCPSKSFFDDATVDCALKVKNEFSSFASPGFFKDEFAKRCKWLSV